MIFGIVCLVLGVLMISATGSARTVGADGATVSVIQRALVSMQRLLWGSVLLRRALFVYPSSPQYSTRAELKLKVEQLVWARLSIIGLAVFLFDWIPSVVLKNDVFRSLITVYAVAWQGVVLLMVSRPLMGALYDPVTDTASQIKPVGDRLSPKHPRRELALSLTNLLELVLAWGLIYRCIHMTELPTMAKACYFSIATLTTLGYGDVSAGDSALVQYMVIMHMLCFVIFFVCKLGVVIGSLSSGESKER